MTATSPVSRKSIHSFLYKQQWIILTNNRAIQIELIGSILNIDKCEDYCHVMMYCLHVFSGLVQDCSNSIANALELLQSCMTHPPSNWYYTQPSTYIWGQPAGSFHYSIIMKYGGRLQYAGQLISCACLQQGVNLTHWFLEDADVILNIVIFKLTSMVDILSTWCEIALRWIPQDFTDDKSTLVHVMAWCLQAPSHFLDQCWPRSVSPYGIARPQYVNIL